MMLQLPYSNETLRALLPSITPITPIKPIKSGYLHIYRDDLTPWMDSPSYLEEAESGNSAGKWLSFCGKFSVVNIQFQGLWGHTGLSLSSLSLHVLPDLYFTPLLALRLDPVSLIFHLSTFRDESPLSVCFLCRVLHLVPRSKIWVTLTYNLLLCWILFCKIKTERAIFVVFLQLERFI